VSTHPYRNDPNAPLWLTLSSNQMNESIGWKTADKLVKEAGGKAGDRKGPVPHVHVQARVCDEERQVPYGRGDEAYVRVVP